MNINIPNLIKHSKTMPDYSETMCRVCLQDYREDFESVYVDHETKSELSPIGLLYEELFQLTIHNNSNHPQLLCNYCSLQMKLFHKFKTKALESHAKFTQTENKESVMVITYSYEQKANELDEKDIKIKSEYDSVDIEESEVDTSVDVIPFDVKGLYENEEEDPEEREIESEFEDVQYLDDIESGDPTRLEIGAAHESVDDEYKKSELRISTGAYPCKNCDMAFTKKSELIKHRSEQHKRTKFLCTLCPKKFFLEELLDVHMRTHYGLAAYECAQCNKSFKHKALYAVHLQGHRNERNLQCHLCGKRFLTKADLKIHIRVHNDERPYECNMCGKRFRVHSHMAYHRFSHFGKKFECPVCRRKYTSPGTLKTHIQCVHEKTMRYECSICNKFFTRKYYLNVISCASFKAAQHKRKRFSCTLCPKKFLSEEQLQVHLNVHQGLPAYQCDLCAKSFNQKVHYVNHINNHWNIRDVQCHLCGKGFLTKSDLKIHLRMHTDERRYQCDICDKKFRAHTHMKNHRYTHFGKTIQCEYCQQMYTSPATLKIHIQSVHQNLFPFSCTVCTKRFKRRHHLSAHMKVHNQKKENNGEYLES